MLLAFKKLFILNYEKNVCYLRLCGLENKRGVNHNLKFNVQKTAYLLQTKKQNRKFEWELACKFYI